jgi:Tol biopolymer transport system component
LNGAENAAGEFSYDWPLTEPPPGNSGDVEGKFSPDGSTIAFRRGGQGNLYLISLAGKANRPARKLTLNNPGVRGIAWSRDGKTSFVAVCRAVTVGESGRLLPTAEL